MNWAQFKDLLSLICAWWHCGSVVATYTRGGRFEPFYCNEKYFTVTEFAMNSVKTFREENSNKYYKCHSMFSTVQAQMEMLELFVDLGSVPA